MSFQLTISNVPDKELGGLIARLNLPRGAKYDVKHIPDHVGLLTGPKRSRMPRTTKLRTGLTCFSRSKRSKNSKRSKGSVGSRWKT